MITAGSASFPAWLKYEWTLVENGLPSSLERINGEARFHACSDAGQCLDVDDVCPGGVRSPELQFPCGGRYPEGYPWQSFGVADGHVVLYLAEPAKAGSYTARYFGSDSELAAGYHLLTMSPTSEQLEQLPRLMEARIACDNERHGRRFAELMNERGYATPEELYADIEAYLALRERMRRDEVDRPCAGDVHYRVAPDDDAIKLSLKRDARGPGGP